MSQVLAPAGWGFLPGFPLGGLTADDLPDLPMLRFLERDRRNAAVLKMLRDNPALVREIRPRDLVAKYGLPQSTSSLLLTRARG